MSKFIKINQLREKINKRDIKNCQNTDEWLSAKFWAQDNAAEIIKKLLSALDLSLESWAQIGFRQQDIDKSIKIRDNTVLKLLEILDKTI